MTAALDCPACGRPNRAGVRFCTGCGDGLDRQPAAGRGLTDLPARAWAPLLGPADRVSFFAEQRRRRGQTWRISAVCALAAILTGIPLSLVLTPILAAAGLLVLKLVTLVTGVPSVLPEAVDRWSQALLDAFSLLDETSGREPSVRVIVTAALLWLLPGMLAMFGLWLLLRGLFLRAGVGAVVLTLGARPPRPGDLEERQLVNVVEEMAIAAGLPAPRVLLLDGPAANAAAVGSGPENATLIVSRPLLDAMDRDATQGVLANLVGSLGNGDLRIATSIIAVYQTFGATSALLKAPLSGDARTALWRLIRFGAFRRGRGDAAAQAETITRLLGRELTEFDTRAIDTEPPSGSIAPPPPGDFWKVLYIMPVPVFAGLVVLRSSDPALFQLALVGLLTGAAIWLWAYRRWVTYTAGRAAAITRAILFLPYFIAVVFPQFLMMIVGPFLLGPLLGWLWRTRRYLADATAVQLTRNPDAVAHGLLQLGEVGGGIPGGAWAAPLFVVGPEATEARRIAQLRSQAPEIQAIHHRMAALRSGHGVASPEHLRAATELAQQLARTQADEGNAAGNEHALTGGLGSIGAFHPPLGERLARLRALGATVAGGAPKRFRGRLSGMPSVLGVPLIALIFVLMAIAAVLIVVVVVLMLAITLAAAAFLMLAVLGLARALFG